MTSEKRGIRISQLVISLLLTAHTSSAQSIDAFMAELNKPVELQLSGRRTFSGRCSDFNKDGFILKSYQSGGQIEIPIKASQIEAIQFPGQEADQYLRILLKQQQSEKALKLYRLLYRQRSKYFPYLAENKVLFFTDYVQLALDTGDPFLAVTIANNIDDFIKNPKAVQYLRDTTLIAYHSLGLIKENIELVKTWLQNTQRFHSSAVGWWIYSDFKYSQEDYQGALWTSLYPLVFSSQLPMPYLDRCYVIAIACAAALENEDYANLLRLEMQQRNIPWPDDMPQFDFLKKEIIPPKPIYKTTPKVKPTKADIRKKKTERNADLPTKTF